MDHVIEANKLTKFYGKSKGIVDVDLQVREGEIFGFIGPNGAGKSTLIRILLNLIFPTSGKASVLGLDCVKHAKEIKEQIGYLPAEINYYDDMTVGDLLNYSAKFYCGSTTKRQLDLTELFEIDTKKRIDTLSHGNKKKVGIVQALLHKPKLLILDEPTSGLDPLMQKHFADLLLQENKEGTTIFFSSHVLGEVQKLCHRVAIIKEGRILKVEDMDSLSGNTFKKVRIALKDRDKKVPSDFEGVIHSSTEQDMTQLLYQGNMDKLVAKLCTMDIENIWIEEPDLNEVFLHYYEKEGAKE